MAENRPQASREVMRKWNQLKSASYKDGVLDMDEYNQGVLVLLYMHRLITDDEYRNALGDHHAVFSLKMAVGLVEGGIF